MFKQGEFTAGGIVDTFIPVEWVSRNDYGVYDMSTELKNREASNIRRRVLKIKPSYYKKFL